MFALFPSRAVAFQFGPLAVHWYGIMYGLAFILAFMLLPKLQKYRDLRLSRDTWTSVISWGVLGVLVGGRLGYVLLYEPAYFAGHPGSILAVWRGGMASHGGFLGVALALFLFAKFRRIPVAKLGDLVSVPAAIGLALGRVGNFINQELYGTPTSLPWGISIPHIEGLRHPLQLYDALGSLCLASICYWHLRTRRGSPGRTLALFLILYGVMRISFERLREQQYPLIDVSLFSISRGQLLTLPMLLLGLLLWRWLRPKE